MSTHRVTLTVNCPRVVSYEDGEPCQCEGDVHITVGITGPSWRPSHSDPGSGHAATRPGGCRASRGNA